MDIFKFALETGLTFDIRVVTLEGAPWFVAADVCKALGMSVERGTYQWLTGLGPDEKNTHRLTMGFRGNPNVACISESGLYKLVLRSDKPQARRFQDWVTREVLPAIRKDGAYVMGEEKVRTGEMVSLSLPMDNSGASSGSGVITACYPTEPISPPLLNT